MAVGAVWCEPASGISLIFREHTGKLTAFCPVMIEKCRKTSGFTGGG